MTDDDLLFDDEDEESGTDDLPEAPPWRVLVVDDEPQIHQVTKLALSEFQFEGRGVKLLSAYSGKEAREVLEKESDIALILLDVVMETDTAGLDLARDIREGMHNQLARIILRTGQPGQTPEANTVREYEINDYKSKAELTNRILDNAVVTALRNYRELKALETTTRGLIEIVDATGNLFESDAADRFTTGLLLQICAILRVSDEAVMIECSGIAAEVDGEIRVVSAIGADEGSRDKPIQDVLPEIHVQRVRKALQKRESFFTDEYVCGYYEGPDKSGNVLYLNVQRALRAREVDLINLLLERLVRAIFNIRHSVRAAA